MSRSICKQQKPSAQHNLIEEKKSGQLAQREIMSVEEADNRKTKSY